MPAIAPGDRVLVTGANGFLGVHVVDILLNKGYAVRGVVRSLDKEDHIKKLFAKYGDKFELAVVKDITVVRRTLFACMCPPGCLSERPRQPGAFDDVLDKIDAIVHTASPFYVDADDPNGDFYPHSTATLQLTLVQDIIVPAVNGTKSILETAVTHGCVPVINSSGSIIQLSCYKQFLYQAYRRYVLHRRC